MILKELFIRKPKLSSKEIAAAIFDKLFKEEIIRTVKRFKKKSIDVDQTVKKNKLILIVISLFVFIVDHSTISVYGNSKTSSKILNDFYDLLREEYNGYDRFIIELAQKFSIAYNKKPDPLLGLGIFFSKCINLKNDRDILTAMIGTTETAKKIKMISNYYDAVNKEYKIY